MNNFMTMSNMNAEDTDIIGSASEFIKGNLFLLKIKNLT